MVQLIGQQLKQMEGVCALCKCLHLKLIYVCALCKCLHLKLIYVLILFVCLKSCTAMFRYLVVWL